MAPEKPDKPKATWEFTEDFSEAYANNVYFESSAWDLKLLFGQLDQSGQLTQSETKIKTIVHTAITVPWAQAKLMLYWLKGHLEAYEAANGKIQMPASIIPPEFPPLTEELKKSDPNAEKIYTLFTKMRNELLADLKK